MPETIDEATARHDDVKRRFQLKAVEAMKRCRGATEGIDRLADGDQQFL
jgi:hypothetical protein